MKNIQQILTTAILLTPLTAVQGQETTNCDIEAAHPSDPNHLGEGKSSSNVDTFAAIAACRQAVKNSPSTARFHYQLGRALVYQGEVVEGLTHVQHAADMNYMQAQFVLSIFKRGEDICLTGSLLRSAANQGLKSARITYANDVLNNAYSGCENRASDEETKSYLAGAATQVDGYYENMLLNRLNDGFKARSE